MSEFIYPAARIIAGVDEVGRGPLVGDVVTAAVILDPQQPIEGLADSKQLSDKRRLQLFLQIQQRAKCWSIGRASPAEIDELNILHATMLAMQRAVAALTLLPDWVLVDGNRTPQFSMPAQAVVKGDSLVAEISAASILAKVTRDAEMLELDQRYPQYGFARHKGYPTALHLQQLQLHGVIPQHRKSFAPVARLLDPR